MTGPLVRLFIPFEPEWKVFLRSWGFQPWSLFGEKPEPGEGCILFTVITTLRN